MNSNNLPAFTQTCLHRILINLGPLVRRPDSGTHCRIEGFGK